MKKVIFFGFIFIFCSSNSEPELIENLETTTSTTSIQADRCLDVSVDILNLISEGDGFSLINGFAVKSNDFSNAYFLSAEFISSGALGIDGEKGTWFLNDIINPDYIEGVGGFGEEYSSWGSATENRSSPYDDGYKESRECNESKSSISSSNSVDNSRKLKIAIYDDSISKKYDYLFIEIVKPLKKNIKPNLEYGSDDIELPEMDIGEVGEFILKFDTSSKSLNICFEPTFESKGDIGNIWIVLNDESIEIDGLAVQDIVIDRSTLQIKELDDNSKPNCRTENLSLITTTSSTTTSTSTTSTSTTIQSLDVISNDISRIENCPDTIGAGTEYTITLVVEPKNDPIVRIDIYYSITVDFIYESLVSENNFTEVNYDMPTNLNNIYNYNLPTQALDQSFMQKEALDKYGSILEFSLLGVSGNRYENLRCTTVVFNLDSPNYYP